MGADKKGEVKTCRNIIVLFLLYGVWMGLQPGCIIYGLLNGFFVCINRFWRKLNVKMPKVFATAITFFSLVLTIPFLFTQNLNNSLHILHNMFNFNFALQDISIKGLNIVFFDPYPSYKINIILLLVALYATFFSKNSTELAEIYVKSNNNFYTIILVITFVIAVLSITKSNEFLYFIF